MKIIHYIFSHNGKQSYLCNYACGTTKTKSTRDELEVTCRNCKREITRRLKK